MDKPFCTPLEISPIEQIFSGLNRDRKATKANRITFGPAVDLSYLHRILLLPAAI